MLVKFNRKKVDKQDNTLPINIEQLIEKYGLERLWLYIDEMVDSINEIDTTGNDKNYVYIQNTASNVWQINHNLHKFPSVTVIDSSGNEVIGDIQYTDINNLIIFFKGAFKGKATLN